MYARNDRNNRPESVNFQLRLEMRADCDHQERAPEGQDQTCCFLSGLRAGDVSWFIKDGHTVGSIWKRAS